MKRAVIFAAFWVISAFWVVAAAAQETPWFSTPTYPPPQNQRPFVYRQDDAQQATAPFPRGEVSAVEEPISPGEPAGVASTTEVVAVELPAAEVSTAAVPSEPVAPAPMASPAPTIPAASVAPVEATSEKHSEEIHRNYSRFCNLRGPDKMFVYMRRAYLYREYKAAGLVLPTTITRVVDSEERCRDLLCQWNYIIDRLEDVDMQTFPTDGTTRHVQQFNTINGPIELEFAKETDGCWHFAPSMVERTPTLYREVLGSPPIRYGFIVKRLPAWSFHIVGGLSYFQWAIVVSGLFVAWLAFWGVRGLLHAVASCWTYFRYGTGVPKEVRDIWRPIAAIVAVHVWYCILHFVILDPRLNDITYYCCTIFSICMGMFVALRIVDLLAGKYRNKYGGNSAHIDDIVVPLIARGVKVVVVCAAVLALADAFNWPLYTVISGMGIGGIAVAFAAKETLGDLFGSITVLIDQPFKVGDWIVTGEIEGTVETVGMRSTRVRTFYNSLVTIPNNQLTTAIIDNMGQRRFRRFRTFISVCYDTPPDLIEQFCEGIRELILLHPNIRSEDFTVELNEMRASSLDILMNVFFVCPDYATENKVRSRLLRDILKLAKSLDVQLAFPTQTLHLVTERKEVATTKFGRVGTLQIDRDTDAKVGKDHQPKAC